jgi:hypothetical protein
MKSIHHYKLIILILLLLVGICFNAHTQSVDSLLKQSDYYRTVNPDSAVNFARQALARLMLKINPRQQQEFTSAWAMHTITATILSWPLSISVNRLILQSYRTTFSCRHYSTTALEMFTSKKLLQPSH